LAPPQKLDFRICGTDLPKKAVLVPQTSKKDPTKPVNTALLNTGSINEKGIDKQWI
jgi:hypothetical protein